MEPKAPYLTPPVVAQAIQDALRAYTPDDSELSAQQADATAQAIDRFWKQLETENQTGRE